MEKCIKCGGTLPPDAKVCPYCGNPVSLYEEKKQPGLPFSSAISPIAPVQPAARKQVRGRTILILAVVVLSGLLILSLAFAFILWFAPPKLAVSPGSLDYGTLQVGSQGSQILTLSNSGRQDLDWSAVKGKADWLTLDPSQGRIPSGGSQTINVRADTTLLTAGQYSASISFISNGGEVSVSAVLIVASGPAPPSEPVISSIEPKTGPATGGTTVTIGGSGFTGASKVLFGSTAASTFTVTSDTQITAVSPAGSGTVHITVITSVGTTATSHADQFTYLTAPPKIASISPTSGPAEGETTVTIRGSGFTGASQVLFGSTASTFTVNSDTQITAVSPAGRGTVHVRVITPVGTTTASDADQFTYLVAPPRIASISPTSGPTTGGTTVIIRGSGFTGASKVLFGSTASHFTVNSDRQITAVSPAGRGTVHVRVITPVGTTVASSHDQFTYLAAPPKITSISPTSGPTAGGTTVTIRGSGFTGASQVLFGSTAASHFTVTSDTQITAVSPAGSGTVHVSVITPVGTTAASSHDQFTYLTPPKIVNIEPKEGPTTGGTTVIIQGSGFTGASKVLFGSTAASTFTVTSDTQITAVSPAGSGTVHVRVITPVGTTAASSHDQFTYLTPPTISGISPTSGPAEGGTTVIIRGSGFTGASQVLFGSTAARTFTVNSDTQITAVSPAGSGTVHVRVITPVGTTATSHADQFTYQPAPPKIASISPTSGPTAGGTTVTIRGSGFTGASQVLFGSTAASTFTVNSDTQITAVSPAGSGTVHVSVITPVGTTAASSHDQFTYLTPPTISGIQPTSGPADGGTTVTIRGSGFIGASQVLFGSTAASTFTVNTDTQITVVSPAGSGTVHVTVITPVGTTAASDADQFTYLTPPKISGIQPTSGPADGGTTVTIRGSGFIGASQVLFGSTAASAFTVTSDTQITAVSPAGSGTVHVSVITPVGTTAASSHDQFTYLTPPKISGIQPTSGPADGGTTVTIRGSGFIGASQVLFGSTAASTFTVTSDTQITAVSPAGSGTVHVTVITPVGTTAASDADQFQYIS